MYDELAPETRAALEALTQRQLPRIQEQDFIRYFLDGFAGKIDNVPLDRWLDVAGNALNPVEVCKGDEVLFVVPPLLGDAELLSHGGQAGRTAEVVAMAQKLNRIHPKQGEAYLQEMLGGRIRHTDKEYAVIRRWNEIFARYGIEQIPLPGKVTTRVDGGGDDKSSITEYEDI